MTVKTIKIKHYGMNIVPPTTKSLYQVRFNFVIDERLSDVTNHFKIKELMNQTKLSNKHVIIRQNDKIKLDPNFKNHVFIDIDDNDTNIINEKIKNSDKVNKAHKDGEFEITTRQEEIEL